MKTRLLLILLATSFIWVSCTEKETYEPETPSQEQSKTERRKISITASLGGGTKTSLSTDDAVLWSVGDKISVFYNGVKSEFVSTNTTPSESAVFEGYVNVPADAVNDQLQLYGVYPHNSANTMSDGTIKITLPSAQNAVAGSFDNNLSISAGKSNGLSMTFYNVCGLLELTVESADVKKVTLKGNNTESPERLSGVLSIEFGSDGKPAISAIESAGNEISLSNADGTPLTVGSKYYMVVPPVSLSNGATFSFVKSNGVIWEKVVSSPLAISRSGIKTVERIDNGAINTSIRYVEFDDNVFKEYCLTNFDSDNDGKISSTEAENATEIKLDNGKDYNKWVNSLKGIEYFTNLEVLWCNNTPSAYYNDKDTPDEKGLKSLDLSSNTELVELRLGTQPFLQNVDVTKCGNLETLVIHGSYDHFKKIDGYYRPTNQVYRSLQTLDLSANNNLKHLSVGGLLDKGALGISHLNYLEYLSISDCEISGIALSSNAPLKELSIYDSKILHL